MTSYGDSFTFLRTFNDTPILLYFCHVKLTQIPPVGSFHELNKPNTQAGCSDCLFVRLFILKLS
jgi:hypothetical protein